MPPVIGFTPSVISSPSRSDSSSTILFDISKKELCSITDGYREVHRILKNRWRVANTKDHESLNFESISSSRLVILAGPQDRYNEAEFNALRQFIDMGGNLLVLLGEGGENKFNTNINFLLEEYGIMINNGNELFSWFLPQKQKEDVQQYNESYSQFKDAVISTVYQKYFHPKECLIGEIRTCIMGSEMRKTPHQILYAHGATLNVARPAVVMATTNTTCLPQQRPIAATYANPRSV